MLLTKKQFIEQRTISIQTRFNILKVENPDWKRPKVIEALTKEFGLSKHSIDSILGRNGYQKPTKPKA